VLSALLYAEYALELGNLDMYFSQTNGKKSGFPQIDLRMISMFGIGVLVGALCVLAVRKKTTGSTITKTAVKTKKK
jgi:hypothetical protein